MFWKYRHGKCMEKYRVFLFIPRIPADLVSEDWAHSQGLYGALLHHPSAQDAYIVFVCIQVNPILVGNWAYRISPCNIVSIYIGYRSKNKNTFKHVSILSFYSHKQRHRFYLSWMLQWQEEKVSRFHGPVNVNQSMWAAAHFISTWYEKKKNRDDWQIQCAECFLYQRGRACDKKHCIFFVAAS